MIPETRGKKHMKYDFKSMKVNSYLVMESHSDAVSIRSSAYARGYKVAIRTIDGEIRAYFLGKR